MSATFKSWRCPCCGKLGTTRAFNQTVQGGHPLEVAFAFSLSRDGKKGGFGWVRDTDGHVGRPMKRADLEYVATAARTASAHLDSVLALLDQVEADPGSLALQASEDIAVSEALPLLRAKVRRFYAEIRAIIENEDEEEP